MGDDGVDHFYISGGKDRTEEEVLDGVGGWSEELIYVIEHLDSLVHYWEGWWQENQTETS